MSRDRALALVLTVSAAAAVWVALHYWVAGWFWHPLVGRGAAFWGGIGSDVGEVTLAAGVVGLFRHVNCHAPWCPRIGRYVTADGHFKLCRKHHPDLPDERPSLAEIHRLHEKAKTRLRKLEER